MGTTPTTTTTTPTTTTPKDDGCVFTCPHAEGIYANPRDCSRFVSCHGYIAYKLDCPSGLVFNPHKTECDFPQNVHCVDDPWAPCILPTVESTTKMTTTTPTTTTPKDDGCVFTCPHAEGIYAN